MKQRIIDYIEKFGSITTFQAFTDLGTTRLSEYIRQIREDRPVLDEWISCINRFGEKTSYKKYFFEKNE